MPAAFAGKVALITGASSGIGAALARELARQGADLVLAARREDRLKALEAEIAGLGRKALAVAGDVTRDGDMERVVAAAREKLGGLDVVVANAGFGVAGRLQDLSIEDYRRQFETNFFGVLRTIYAALPELVKRKGQLAVIGSVSGHVPTAGMSGYCSSKFAVRGLVESLHDELATEGVGCTLISPGFVESDLRTTDNRGVHHADKKDPVPAWLVLSSTKAAKQIARAIASRRRELVVTGHGKATVFAYRHVPGVVNLVLSKFGAPKRRPEKMGD